jgi:glycosyltransferase involved in cell wall biosynthesis
MQDSQADLENSAEYLKALVWEVKPDLLHLSQFFYGALPVDVPRLVVAHSDVVSWWVAVHGHEPSGDGWMNWYRDLVTRGLSHATAVVAPSQWMLDQLATFYLRPAIGRVIYNGRSPELFDPGADKQDCVLSVGRLWDSGKQVALLTEQSMPVPVCIVGSDVHPHEAFRTGSRRNGTNAGLHFPGSLSEAKLSAYYSRAAIYAATSRYEPFGLAPVEAALSRCAIVANDIPTFHELWGDAAVYFPRNDPAGLAEMVQHLYSDRHLLERCANLACERARARFAADRMVEEYLALYDAMVPAEVAAA